MTYLEEYNMLVEMAEKQYKGYLAVLEKTLKLQQKDCKHNWVRVEQLFYALGETAPGMRCTECGLTKHVKQRRGWF